MGCESAISFHLGPHEYGGGRRRKECKYAWVDNEPRSVSFNAARSGVVWKAAAGLQTRAALVARNGARRMAKKVISRKVRTVRTERGLRGRWWERDEQCRKQEYAWVGFTEIPEGTVNKSQNNNCGSAMDNSESPLQQLSLKIDSFYYVLLRRAEESFSRHRDVILTHPGA